MKTKQKPAKSPAKKPRIVHPPKSEHRTHGIVRIELHVDQAEIQSFLSDWSDLMQTLIEQASIAKAEMELPPTDTHTIELSRW